MTTRTLKPRDLLQGTLYAIENAGHLLRDAVTLYEQGRFASAVVLAVYCREELGRSEILLDMARNAADSRGVQLQDVRDRCKKHIDKLTHGQAGITLRVTPAQTSRLGPLFTNQRNPDYTAARADLDRAIQAKTRRNPLTTNERRLRALYVDPTDDGRWHRPSQQPSSDAFDLLDEVAGDYAMRLDRLRLDDPELSSLISEWPDAPELLPPSYPRMPSQD